MKTLSSPKSFLKLLLRNVSSPERVALVLMLTFGIVFMVLIKPLQTPDEASHFLRAYELSEGKLFASKSTKQGCILQDSQMLFDTQQPQASMPKSVASFTDLNRDDYSVRSQLKIHLNSSSEIPICSTQMEANSPIGYLPQVVAISVLKPFNAPPILMDYFARLLILTAWATFIYYAIKIIPVRKWALVAIALLPIAIQQSISIGADALSIAPTALFMAYMVRSYYEDRRNHLKKDLLSLTALVTMVTLSKPITMVLVLMIPFYYVQSSKRSIISRLNFMKLATILTPVVFYLIWSVLAAHHNASADDVFNLAQIKSQYFKYDHFNELRVFARNAENYTLYGLSLDQFGSFKWFTKSIPQTFDYWGIVFLALVVLVGYDDDKRMIKKITSKRVKWLNAATVVTALGVLCANILTLFIIWTPLGSFGVQGIQFRYFLPVLMVMACIVEAKFLRSSERWYRNFVLANSIGFFVLSVLTLTSALLTV